MPRNLTIKNVGSVPLYDKDALTASETNAKDIKEINETLETKQDVIKDLDSIRSGAKAGSTAYQLPSDGIPKDNLSQGVQDSLDKADSACQDSTEVVVEDTPTVTIPFVEYVKQALTEAQQKQTRDNIGAASQSDMATVQSEAHEHSNKSVLDGITADNITDWNSKATSAKVDELDLKIVSLQSGKEDKLTDATAIASTGLVDGTKYTLGEITELDLTTIPTSNTKGILIYFSTSADGCTLTYSENTNWLGSDAPSVEASKNYVVLIADNICGISEYEPQTIS